MLKDQYGNWRPVTTEDYQKLEARIAELEKQLALTRISPQEAAYLKICEVQVGSDNTISSLTYKIK